MREKEVLFLASKAAATLVREENSQIPIPTRFEQGLQSIRQRQRAVKYTIVSERCGDHIDTRARPARDLAAQLRA